MAKAYCGNEIYETHLESIDKMPPTTVQDRYRLYRPLEENKLRILDILFCLEGDIVQCQLKYINLNGSIEYNALSYT